MYYFTNTMGNTIAVNPDHVVWMKQREAGVILTLSDGSNHTVAGVSLADMLKEMYS